MKKCFALLLALIMVFGLVACSETGNQPTDTSSVQSTATTAAAAQTASVTDSSETDASLTDPASADSAQTDSAQTDSAQTDSSTDPAVPTVCSSAAEQLSSTRHWLGVTDQRNGRIAIYDLGVADWDDPKAVVWEYRDYFVQDGAGLKFRHNDKLGGDLVLFCGGPNAGIIDMKTKKLVFYTDDVPGNPHTVELLPDGTFLVGGTDGKMVYVYDSLGKSDRHTCAFSPKIDVHGLLWDPEYEVLWLAGANNLTAYALSGTAAKLTFTPVSSMATDKLKKGVHDLAPVYGDKTKLWITCTGGVVQVDKDTMEISQDYAGAEHTGKNYYTPGVGNYPDGTLAWVVPTKCMNEWNADELFAFVPYGDGQSEKVTFRQPKDAWYKCRVFCTDYQ